MSTKFIIAFCIVALATAFGGSVPAKGPVFHVTLSEAATANGTALKAGEYRVTVNADKATFAMGKESHEVAVKVETNEKKYDNNQVIFSKQGEQNLVKQICVGGTKTRL